MSSERNVKCQLDGWPEGVTEAEKTALTKAVRDILRYRGALPLGTVLDLVKHNNWTGWAPGPLLDYQYETIERACRAAGGETVWRLDPSVAV